MSRRKFIESHGATCKNWNWSWSFVNHEMKFVIFGTWDQSLSMEKSIILKESWVTQTNRTTGIKRKASGYKQALQHLALVTDEGYQLKIFRMVYNERVPDSDIAKIKTFEEELHERQLLKEGEAWYAVVDKVVHSESLAFPDEVPEEFYEGGKLSVMVNAYERNPEARAACLTAHGYLCKICDFDFEKTYGPIGKRFIHVHHKTPLHTIKKEYKVDPVNDLIPVCPNCHAMLHREKNKIADHEMLKDLIRRLKNN
ncbi:HNH endonuclease [Franconibacter pulveris 1160]|uniref:HNH endonuclease n=1 Tax=Franconibacter pulveris TaxID=435910 RepID=UPI000464A8B2|nr:HNH endonuclease [Franconibacter pulveris]